MDPFKVSLQQEKSKRTSEWVLKLFRKFQLDTNNTVDLKKDKPHVIAETLRSFYCSLRKSNGELYPAGTLRSIRSGLHRYITLPPNPRSDINVCDKKQFTAANNMLKTKAKSYTKQDYAVLPVKKEAITVEDFVLIGEFLKVEVYSTPENLVMGVWFVLCFTFGKRGRESWANYNTSDLAFHETPDGEKYITLREKQLVESKTYQSGLSVSDVDCDESTKLYNQPDREVNPYKIVQVYIDKIPQASEDQRLFLLPNKDYQQEGKPWYNSKKPAGKNTIASYMKNISSKLNLSKSYSNHTVGKTSFVSCLSNAGFASHQISNLTHHKNFQSLQSYCAQSGVETLDENPIPTAFQQKQGEIPEDDEAIMKQEFNEEVKKETSDMENFTKTADYSEQNQQPSSSGACSKSRTCPVCWKVFKAASFLKRHQVTHTGERNHECQICGKTFTQSSNLKRHHLTHTGKKSCL